MPAPGLLSTLRAWCSENGVVFIADEVQSGFARTRTMIACEDEGIEGDLIITARGILIIRLTMPCRRAGSKLPP